MILRSTGLKDGLRPFIRARGSDAAQQCCACIAALESVDDGDNNDGDGELVLCFILLCLGILYFFLKFSVKIN